VSAGAVAVVLARASAGGLGWAELEPMAEDVVEQRL
jgi:hypothetical protein